MVEAVRAKKTLGQHFLVDESYCTRIVELLDASPADTIVEIGPGTGQLTRLLVTSARRVIAVELDAQLVRLLKERFSEALANGQLVLEHDDVLAFRWLERIEAPSPKLIGNLPYNVATRILTKTADICSRFHSLTVMVQKEVAERILAKTSDPDYGYLSVLMALHYQRRRGFDVPAGAFQPPPKVVSHVLQLAPRSEQLPPRLRSSVLSLVSRAFRHPRKTLWNNLKGSAEHDSFAAAVRELELDARCRPAQVSPEQYVSLAQLL